MLLSLAVSLALTQAASSQAAPIRTAPTQDSVIATAKPTVGTVDSERYREAVAYANPMPRGAPEQDYPLVAWCEALVNGHVALGETLTNADDLDRDIIRLGKAEAATFRAALDAGQARQSAQTRRAAQAAAAEATALWTPLQGQDEATRSRAFGLFFGLPGRCEHAARRVRNNITTPPATPAQVGIVEGPPAASSGG